MQYTILNNDCTLRASKVCVIEFQERKKTNVTNTRFTLTDASGIRITAGTKSLEISLKELRTLIDENQVQ